MTYPTQNEYEVIVTAEVVRKNGGDYSIEHSAENRTQERMYVLADNHAEARGLALKKAQQQYNKPKSLKEIMDDLTEQLEIYEELIRRA